MKPNILLVILDSARVHNMGVYGYEKDTTPFMSELADVSSVYTQTRSPGIHSIASHVSIFTGYDVVEHGAIYHESIIDTEQTIWKRLSGSGYKTGLFTRNMVVSSASNLDDCFDHVDVAGDKDHEIDEKPFPAAFGPGDIPTHEGITGNIRRSISDDRPVRSLGNCLWRFLAERNESSYSPGFVNVDDFIEWKDETETWAACLNLMDTHYPYPAASEYEEFGRVDDDYFDTSKIDLLRDERWDVFRELERAYDNALLQADAIVRYLVEQIDLDDTLLVITSDHGEGFGERNEFEPDVPMFGHTWGVHECLTHVPLIVHQPHQEESKVIAELSSTKRFPDVVDGYGSGDEVDFTCDVALSYTKRMLPSDVQKFSEFGVEAAKYAGPWKCVYCDDGDHIKRYLTHHGECQVSEISTEEKVVPDEDCGIVEREFQTIEDVEVTIGEHEVSADLEHRLSDLGYLR